MPITNIDREAAGTIRQLLNDALAHVAAQHGLKITVGRGKFTPTDISFEVNAAVIVDGEAQTPARKLWERSATLLGLKPEWLGCTVPYGGQNYRIDGLRAGAPTYNVVASDNSGKTVFLKSTVIARNAERGMVPTTR